MKTKYYAAYNSSVKKRENWENHKNWTIIDMIITGGPSGFPNSSKATENKEVAMRAAEELREENRISRQYSKNPTSLFYKVFVHQCNSKGYYLPTLGEVKKALEWAADKAMESPSSAWKYAEVLGKDVKVVYKELLQKIGE